MKITVNGKPLELNNQMNIDRLIAHLNITGKVAIELNQEIIPRSQFQETTVQPNDTIEIVHAIGGG